MPKPWPLGCWPTKVALLATAILALSATTLPIVDARSAGNAQSDKAELEIEKLQEEVRKLEIENDQAESSVGQLLRWGPFIAVAGGVITVLVAVRQELRENRQQRKNELKQRENELEEHREQAELDRRQRENELKQEQVEAQRRFDELFGQAVANLGSDKESVQLSAVVILENFLRSDDPVFHAQIYSVVCANLGLQHTPLVNRFLVRAFEKAIRALLSSRVGDGGQEALDLANCRMPRVDLHGLPLNKVDLAFATLLDANLVGTQLTEMHGYDVNLERARLSDANLTGARLHGAQCKEAQFHRASLVDAKLRPSKNQRADLQSAEFYGARMQGAHLEGAHLAGARFDDATLSDAYFGGATFDDKALRSILKAKVVKGRPIWDAAHFDQEIRAKLQAMT